MRVATTTRAEISGQCHDSFVPVIAVYEPGAGSSRDCSSHLLAFSGSMFRYLQDMEVGRFRARQLMSATRGRAGI
jgi:hypothetical protein